jgi:cytochrome P450
MIEPETTCPYTIYKQMRSEAAVTLMPTGMYAVTRFEDVKAVLLDADTFSAVISETSPFETYGPCPVKDQIEHIMRNYREKSVLVRNDPPSHTEARKHVRLVLVPEKVREFVPDIKLRVQELAAGWLDKGKVDFVAEFALKLPNGVTTGLLGSPSSMRKKFKLWADETMSRFDGPQSPERQLEVAQNIADFGDYIRQEITKFRQHPANNLVSMLANSEIDGSRMDDETIINAIHAFLVGGQETTMFLLAQAIYEFAKDRSLADSLRNEPEKIPAFVEELLRRNSPAQAVLRRPVRDVDIGGVKVPADSTLCVILASANRDDSVFKDPDSIILDRANGKRHLAFGYGIHTCIGLHLARTEARLALEYLLPRMHDIELASDQATSRMENFMLSGFTRLDITFTPSHYRADPASS